MHVYIYMHIRIDIDIDTNAYRCISIDTHAYRSISICRCESFTIGSPHRGRLNMLANVMHKPMPEILEEFIQGTLSTDAKHDQVCGVLQCLAGCCGVSQCLAVCCRV